MRAKLGIGRFVLAVSVLAACGGGDLPEAKSPEASGALAASPRAPKKRAMSVSTELGEIDRAATEQTFQALQAPLGACFRAGLARVDYLGGDLAFFLRVGADGKAKFAYLEESSLGDRETERCMLSVVRGAAWPKPEGGEAEVRKKVGFDPPGDVRVPASWSSDRISATLGTEAPKAEECKLGAPGKYTVTAYVEPDGKSGKVQAVGVAPPSRDGEGKVECIVEVVKGMKMPSPGSYAAKVSFTL